MEFGLSCPTAFLASSGAAVGIVRCPQVRHPKGDALTQERTF
jgi:hypothetical protein